MDGGFSLEHFEPRAIKSSAITLVNGASFDPLNPDPKLMTLDVIAAAAANMCRYAGQISSFFSIAQHQVLVAALGPRDSAAQRCGLLHDGDELFGLPDLPTPVKPFFPEYVNAQHRIGTALDSVYGITAADHKRTKYADVQAFGIEVRTLKPVNCHGELRAWEHGLEVPSDIDIIPLPPKDAHDLYARALHFVLDEGGVIDREWLRQQPGFKVS